MRRIKPWLRRFTSLVVTLVVVAIIIGFTYERVSRMRAAEAHPPPGVLVRVGAANMHLNCVGEGTPVVVLETGLSPFGSLDWYAIQPEVARFTTVCSYDRAGLLWSENRGVQRSGELMVGELHDLLRAADVPSPYVMVGHSIGGLLTRMYHNQFPNEISGFVFVDSTHPDVTERFGGAGGGRRPPPVPLWLMPVLSETGLLRIISSSWQSPGPSQAVEPLRALFPQRAVGWYAEQAAPLETMRQSKEIDGAIGSLGPRPVVVLSRGTFASDETRNIWMQMQQELNSLSTNSDHRIVEGAGHSIHFDDPDAVITAIKDVVIAARSVAAITHR